MRNSLIIFLFLPLVIPAQKYQGKYYNPESKGYTGDPLLIDTVPIILAEFK